MQFLQHADDDLVAVLIAVSTPMIPKRLDSRIFQETGVTVTRQELDGACTISPAEISHSRQFMQPGWLQLL